MAHIFDTTKGEVVSLEQFGRGAAMPRINYIAQKAGIENFPVVVMKGEETPFIWTDMQKTQVGVTEGLANLLNDRELAAMTAHEVSHIKNRHFDDPMVVSLISPGVRVLTAGSLGMLGMFLSFVHESTSSTQSSKQKHKATERSQPTDVNRRKFLKLLGIGLGGGTVGHACSGSLGDTVQNRVQWDIEERADRDAVRFSNDPEALASAFQKVDQWFKARGNYHSGCWKTFGERVKSIQTMQPTANAR